MGRIFCMVGKSASGKDTLYKRILGEEGTSLVPVIPYTTRPKRSGEKEGEDYHFVTQEQLERYEVANQVVEKRQYHTTQGLWTYFTMEFDLDKNCDYIMITTLEGAASIMERYGADKVFLIYLTLDDRTRLLRCIEREARQETPDYEEVCRRFIADQRDFSEEHIRIFKNLYCIDTKADVEICLRQWMEWYRGHPHPAGQETNTNTQQ